jgi:tRNA(His) 5'-end guanylyltransferase
MRSRSGKHGDDLGDRMKKYEQVETGRRFLPLLPVYARLDGRCFSKFTKGMRRPYDPDMSAAMIETTRALVEKTNALVGYTQSDEISLVWFNEDSRQQIYFDGKTQKMVSCLAADATAEFLIRALELWPEKSRSSLPRFDCRVMQLPNKDECANMLLWREKDAVKNSITMAASAHFSHRELLGVGTAARYRMLLQKGVDWNDYPVSFKRGSWIRRRRVLRHLTEEELARIPAKNRPTAPVWRRECAPFEMPPLSRIENLVDVIFDAADPIEMEISAARAETKGIVIT